MDDKSRDICFSRAGDWFRYRACGIIIEDGCVLVAGNDRDDYFYSIGGAVKFGETAEEACLREVFEETGVAFEIERLLFIHENFFKGDGSSSAQNCHELAFYFLMKARGDRSLLSEDTEISGGKQFLKWLPISDYKKYKAYPKFFAEKLQNLPDQVERIATHE